MKIRKIKPNILLLFVVVFSLSIITNIILSIILNNITNNSCITIVFILLSIIYLFLILIYVIQPLIQQYKRITKTKVDPGNNFTNTWKMLNSLLSGLWIDIMEENHKLLKKDFSNQMLLNQIRFNTLQSQINPHFLYNSIDSIRGFAMIENSQKIAEMAEALASFFRYNISHDTDIVELESELKNINNYFIIQSYRFSNRFMLEKDFDVADKEITKYPIPKLTIQPLVENAVFHGLERRRGKGKVVISIEKTLSRLYIRVSDNGIGMDDSTVRELNRMLRSKMPLAETSMTESKNGVALINVNQRISALYGNSYGLNIKSTLGQGTEVELVFPFPAEIESSLI